MLKTKEYANRKGYELLNNWLNCVLNIQKRRGVHVGFIYPDFQKYKRIATKDINYFKFNLELK